MPSTTRPKRSYQSSVRSAGAMQTRQAIARSAMDLFVKRGYRGASIDAIAEGAQVAPETIYATFGNKREILHYLLDITAGGDEQDVRLIDRPEQQSVLHGTDSRQMAADFSEGVARILERTAPVFSILVEAAKTDPELQLLLERIQSERLENMTLVAKTLGRLEALRISDSMAAETIWALTSPELFNLFTGVRLWTREQYTHWLKDSLNQLLF